MEVYLFKQVILLLLFSIISYIITSYYLKQKFIYFSLTTKLKNESKYHIKNTTKTTLQNLVYFSELSGFQNLLFTTKGPKNKLNQDNYIYDKKNDYYHLIENGYYYYIKDSKDYTFHGNPEIFYTKIK